MPVGRPVPSPRSLLLALKRVGGCGRLREVSSAGFLGNYDGHQRLCFCCRSPFSCSRLFPPLPPHSSEGQKDKQNLPQTKLLWDCSVCTFRNSAEAFKCSICDVRKGTSTRYLKISITFC